MLYMSNLECPQCFKVAGFAGYEEPHFYDGILFWVCSSCGFGWPRHAGNDTLATLAQIHANEWNRRRSL